MSLCKKCQQRVDCLGGSWSMDNFRDALCKKCTKGFIQSLIMSFFTSPEKAKEILDHDWTTEQYKYLDKYVDEFFELRRKLIKKVVNNIPYFKEEK